MKKIYYDTIVAAMAIMANEKELRVTEYKNKYVSYWTTAAAWVAW